MTILLPLPGCSARWGGHDYNDETDHEIENTKKPALHNGFRVALALSAICRFRRAADAGRAIPC